VEVVNYNGICPVDGLSLPFPVCNHQAVVVPKVPVPVLPGLPDFSAHNLPKWGKIYQMTTKLPIGHIIYQTAESIPNDYKIFIRTFSIPTPSKIYPNYDILVLK
jgi:hypothetical protein